MVAQSKDQDSPRFDFGPNIDPVQPRTETVAELLKEINREYNPKSGEPANFKSLDRVLGFIHEITGEAVPNLTAPVPLSMNRPGFCRHLGAMENGLIGGVYEQQAVHG